MSNQTSKCGRLELYPGPMFAGKTQALMQVISKYVSCNKSCIFINSHIDDRNNDKKFSTHSPLSKTFDDTELFTKFKVDKLFEVYEVALKYDVIAIDEQHFYPDLVNFVSKLLKEGKIILVAGLNGDFNMNPIGEMYKMYGMADTIEHVRAKCFQCIKQEPPYNCVDAPFTVKKKRDRTGLNKVIESGGKDKYYAACRSCYIKSFN